MERNGRADGDASDASPSTARPGSRESARRRLLTPDRPWQSGADADAVVEAGVDVDVESDLEPGAAEQAVVDGADRADGAEPGDGNGTDGVGGTARPRVLTPKRPWERRPAVDFSGAPRVNAVLPDAGPPAAVSTSERRALADAELRVASAERRLAEVTVRLADAERAADAQRRATAERERALADEQASRREVEQALAAVQGMLAAARDEIGRNEQAALENLARHDALVAEHEAALNVAEQRRASLDRELSDRVSELEAERRAHAELDDALLASRAQLYRLQAVMAEHEAAAMASSDTNAELGRRLNELEHRHSDAADAASFAMRDTVARCNELERLLQDAVELSESDRSRNLAAQREASIALDAQTAARRLAERELAETSAALDEARAALAAAEHTVSIVRGELDAMRAEEADTTQRLAVTEHALAETGHELAQSQQAAREAASGADATKAALRDELARTQAALRDERARAEQELQAERARAEHELQAAASRADDTLRAERARADEALLAERARADRAEQRAQAIRAEVAEELEAERERMRRELRPDASPQAGGPQPATR